MYDVIIIGAGPAGLTAGIYTTRYGLKSIIIAKDFGSVTKTVWVENYPGFLKIKGVELINRMVQHVKSLDIEIRMEEVLKIKKKQNFIIETTNDVYKSKAVIFATGSRHRKLNIPGEATFLGRGISYCVSCDAYFFKNKIVAVVGGRNSAVSAALFLSDITKKVFLIYRGEKLKADPILVEQLNRNKKIKVIYNAVPVRFNGDKTLKQILLSNKRNLNVDGVFIEIGLIPNTDIIKELDVKLNNKRIVVNPDMSTNIKGFFAAGDVTNASNRFDQIVTATAEGAIAANSVYKFLRFG